MAKSYAPKLKAVVSDISSDIKAQVVELKPIPPSYPRHIPESSSCDISPSPVPLNSFLAKW